VVNAPSLKRPIEKSQRGTEVFIVDVVLTTPGLVPVLVELMLGVVGTSVGIVGITDVVVLKFKYISQLVPV
jgi:hypothetical protein